MSDGSPTAGRGAASPAAPARPARRRSLIKVDPAEVRRGPLGTAERLRDDAKASLPGLAVSAGMHVVLLLLMALIFVQAPPRDEMLMVELDWSLPSKGPAAASSLPSPNEPTFKPLVLPSAMSDPAAAKPTAPPPTPAAAPQKGNDQPGVVKPVAVDQLLDGRRDEQRQPLLHQAGGTDQTERAIADGLKWLVRQQQSAGNWKLHEGYPDAGQYALRTDTGATALALLALVGNGSTHQQGEHREAVQKGLDWLLGVQKPNGDFHDHHEFGRQTAFYAHSQAVIVVAELYALTHDERLREPLERGVRYLIESQQPVDGGWKYQPQTAQTVGDLSVTGWALMALHTARAAGVAVPEDVFQLSSRFLDAVADDDGALYRYEPNPNKPATAALTAEGLLCRQYLGWPKDRPAMRRGVQWLLRSEHEPAWAEGRRNVYAWYYTGHVLHNLGGPEWETWYRHVEREIVPHQNRRGVSKRGFDTRGSWDPTNPRGADDEHAHMAGRLYVTALSLLILETPYRHLPVYGE